MSREELFRNLLIAGGSAALAWIFWDWYSARQAAKIQELATTQPEMLNISQAEMVGLVSNLQPL